MSDTPWRGCHSSMSDLTIQNGRVKGGGGGILVDEGAGLALANCTLRGNKAVVGGAVHNHGTATFTNCTLSRNRATGGPAGISNYGTATLINCTLSRNGGRGIAGGGIGNWGTATLINTIVANSGRSNWKLHGLNYLQRPQPQ